MTPGETRALSSAEYLALLDHMNRYRREEKRAAEKRARKR